MGCMMLSIYEVSFMCVGTRISITFRRLMFTFRGLSPGGDFQQQFPSTKMNASDVLTGLKEYVAPGSTVFIATNERNHSYFSSIAQFYDVIFLEDFSELLTSISKSNICCLSPVPSFVAC